MASTYSKLLFHIVFSTQNRLPLISHQWQQKLYHYIGGIIRGENGMLVEIGGIEDHVHMLVQLKPTNSLPELLKTVKAKSSKWLNDQNQNQNLRKFGWQDGYAAFTVSESQTQRVVDYIRSQKEHHQKNDFKAEFIALLKKHNIEYEEKYLW